MYGEDKYNIEYSDFLLRMVMDEMSRCRDWPLKILTFTSALHFGILVAIISSKILFTYSIKFALSFLFTILMVWTVYYFWRCHKTYLELRNSQIELECQIGIQEMDVLPAAWFKKRNISPFTAFWGWGFYSFIAVSFWLSVVGVLWVDITG